MGTEGETHRSLDFGQQMKLAQWLKKNRDLLCATRPRKREAAELATAELGFEVSPNSLARIRKHVGVMWAAQRSRRPGIGLGTRVSRLEAQLDAICHALGVDLDNIPGKHE